MADPLRILLVGASGRMGREIGLACERAIGSDREFEIVGGIVNPENPLVGSRLSFITEPLDSEFRTEFARANVIVDFSSERGACVAMEIAAQHTLPLLLASTGLSAATVEQARQLASQVPVILTANTSLAVTAMKKLARDAALMLKDGFDIELVEIHHRHKKDSPSGTALMLLREIASAQGKSLEAVLECGRAGLEATRIPGTIGAQAVRGGDVAGEHSIYFLGEGERLEITQRATTRRIFADGAIRAAFWLRDQKDRSPGLFTMEDVLMARSAQH